MTSRACCSSPPAREPSTTRMTRATTTSMASSRAKPTITTSTSARREPERRRKCSRTPCALPGPAGMCFDAACQATQDRAFVAAVLFPLAAAFAAAVFVWNNPSKASSRPLFPPSRPSPSSDSRDSEEEGVELVSFVDPATGMIFEGDTPPERDRSGKLALRAFSFTPLPVEEGSPGERIRIDVGEVGNRNPRTYVFEKLNPDSNIVAVTLPRPAGVVFAEKVEEKRGETTAAVVVDELLDGSPAQKRLAAAKLDPSLESAALLPGDVLRGFTTTNFVFRGAGLALLGVGLKPPTREVVVFGADQQSWPSVKAALQRGDSSDGDMTIIVERRAERKEVRE